MFVENEMFNCFLCRKKYYIYLKYDGLWGCFFFCYFNIYEVKKMIGLFCDIYMYSNLKEN